MVASPHVTPIDKPVMGQGWTRLLSQHVFGVPSGMSLPQDLVVHLQTLTSYKIDVQYTDIRFP